jgi:hypothetical protein
MLCMAGPGNSGTAPTSPPASGLFFTVHPTGLFLQLALEIGEGPMLFSRYLPSMPCMAAVEADHLSDSSSLENIGHAAGLLFEDDLEQDAARQVFAGLGVHHLEILKRQHQILDVGQGDVGARLGVVKTAVRVFLDQSRTAVPT